MKKYLPLLVSGVLMLTVIGCKKKEAEGEAAPAEAPAAATPAAEPAPAAPAAEAPAAEGAAKEGEEPPAGKAEIKVEEEKAGEKH